MCTQFSNPYSQIDDISMFNGISVCPVQTSPNVFLKHLIAFVYFNSYKQVRRWLKLDESECYSFLPACFVASQKEIPDVSTVRYSGYEIIPCQNHFRF